MRQDLSDCEIRGLARGRLQVGELGQILRDGIGDRELALILQHENRDTGDRLSHRGDPEQRVGRHRTFRRDVGETGRLDVEHLILGHDGSDGAGDLVVRDHRLHRCSDAGELRALGDDRQRGGQCKGDGEAVRLHAEEMYLLCSLIVKWVHERRRLRPAVATVYLAIVKFTSTRTTSPLIGSVADAYCIVWPSRRTMPKLARNERKAGMSPSIFFSSFC